MSVQGSKSIRKGAISLELLVPNKPTTNLPRLVEGQPQGDGGDEEDAGGVVIISITDPQHDAEHLEDVEGIEHLEGNKEMEQVWGAGASSSPS